MSITTSLVLKSGFYQNLILNAFEKMHLGTLHVLLPNGTQLSFGSDAKVLANIEIKNERFFKRCVLYGDIGFGESYVDGDWDTDNITQLIKWFILNIENSSSLSGGGKKSGFLNVLKFINQITHSKRANSLSGSKKNISEHYDLNNAFFALFLDKTMTYSSAYFKENTLSLEQAQIAKYDRLCKQLRLNQNDHVLEIGSGWGANAVYMAKQYDCKVTSLTISEEQFKYATNYAKRENVSDKVTFYLKDYRLMEGQFDKIVSIEMLEAVGEKYYNDYFSKCNSLLKKEGLLALQVITCPDSRFEQLKNGVDWIQKHIFPGSLLPSVGVINKAINNVCDLTMIDLKEMGLDYANTLHIWHQEFNKNSRQVKELGFDDYFIRKWNYYLCYC